MGRLRFLFKYFENGSIKQKILGLIRVYRGNCLTSNPLRPVVPSEFDAGCDTPETSPFLAGNTSGANGNKSSQASSVRTLSPEQPFDDPQPLQIPQRVFPYGHIHLVPVPLFVPSLVSCPSGSADSVAIRHQEFRHVARHQDIRVTSSGSLSASEKIAGEYAVEQRRIAGDRIGTHTGDETPHLHFHNVVTSGTGKARSATPTEKEITGKVTGSAMDPVRPARRNGNHEKRNAHQCRSAGGKPHCHH